MFLYEVFQTRDSLRESSMLWRGELTQSELIARRMSQSEADIMSLVLWEVDRWVVQDTREKTRRTIEAEVQILAQKAQEIKAAIARGVEIILGIHEEKKAFLKTPDSYLVNAPHDLEGKYILRAPIPARFQSLPPLPEGLIPIIDDASRQRISEWPQHVLAKYMGRRTECLSTMTASEIMNHVTKNWQYPYFLKTLTTNASAEIG